MDPDATLAEIRRHVEKQRNGTLDTYTADRLAYLVECLDEWLSNGGFLPEGWEK